MGPTLPTPDDYETSRQRIWRLWTSPAQALFVPSAANVYPLRVDVPCWRPTDDEREHLADLITAAVRSEPTSVQQRRWGCRDYEGILLSDPMAPWPESPDDGSTLAFKRVPGSAASVSPHYLADDETLWRFDADGTVRTWADVDRHIEAAVLESGRAAGEGPLLHLFGAPSPLRVAV